MVGKTVFDIGRGNELGTPIETLVGPTVASFTLSTAFTANNWSNGGVLIVTVPQPDESNLVIEISRSAAIPSGGDINIAAGLNQSGAQIAASINLAIGSNANLFTSTYVADADTLVISNVTTGSILKDPSLSTAVFTVTGPSISDIFRGSEGITRELTAYKFVSPFSDGLPSGDSLQGMARIAMLLESFLQSVSNATTDANLISATSTLRTALLATFPQNFSSSGITRDSDFAGTIALKGSRRKSDGSVGRGKRSIKNIFVNTIADYSLKQLIIRIYDSATDIFSDIAEEGPVADVASRASGELREFDVEFEELRRALGMTDEIYENTIVDLSSDQGMLIYSDELAQAAVRFSPGGNRVALNNALSGIDKLKLRN